MLKFVFVFGVIVLIPVVLCVSVSLDFKGKMLNNLDFKRLNHSTSYQAAMNAEESTNLFRPKRHPSGFDHGLFNVRKCPRGMVALNFGPGGCVTCMTYFRITGNKRC